MGVGGSSGAAGGGRGGSTGSGGAAGKTGGGGAGGTGGVAGVGRGGGGGAGGPGIAMDAGASGGFDRYRRQRDGCGRRRAPARRRVHRAGRWAGPRRLLLRHRRRSAELPVGRPVDWPVRPRLPHPSGAATPLMAAAPAARRRVGPDQHQPTRVGACEERSPGLSNSCSPRPAGNFSPSGTCHAEAQFSRVRFHAYPAGP